MSAAMEGFLQVPPDRGTIIGRAVWKNRYVVLGAPTRPQPPSDPALPRTTSSTRLQSVRKGLKSSPVPKEKQPALENVTLPSANELWISIYKQKGDGELIQQIPVRSITSCEIKSIQYRKPGPALPTLLLTFEPDPAQDKIRRRRSSRTGGLSSSQNAFPNSLLFRTIPEERFNIYDWQITIQPEIKPLTDTFDAPMSPQSPIFDSFINPFAGSVSGGSSANNSRPTLHHRGSSTTYASLNSGIAPNRPATSTLISPSPSLRSRSSDISSSQVSFFNRQPGVLPIQQLPSDLPSPASTAAYDDGQSILGWTSAQGRSSALSNHTRAGSNSVSVVGTPPAPRETILDRAFQMRYIPGSDRVSTAEDDRMSSIARFEALMKEAEERRKLKDSGSNSRMSSDRARKSSVTGWELEEEDEDSASDDEPTGDMGMGYDNMDEDEVDPLALSIHEMPTPAQRALEYISGRSTPLPQRRAASPAPPLPVQTSRPQPPARVRTAPPVSHRPERPRSLIVTSTNYLDPTAANDNPSSSALKRNSSTSTKRLSFTDFAKRLSSTSSLLLVQSNTNASSQSGAGSGTTSSRNSFDDEGLVMHRGLSQSRLSGMSAPPIRSGVYDADMNVRNHWRGSGLGVFGGEEGFL